MGDYDNTRSVLQLNIKFVLNTFEDDEVSTKDIPILAIKMIEKFTSALKKKLGGHLEDKILISSLKLKDVCELKEGIKKLSDIYDYEGAQIYMVLTKKIPIEELDKLFLDMDEYGFAATFPNFPNDENKLITQGYENGEYDTGYFSNDQSSTYIEILPGGSNEHFRIKDYIKAQKLLLK